ncbi:tannase/feruloyl esterase family alpha/beta hydrolase [Microbacterium karelineae]|uniref:tannase/feruloyl esterase family alpha/beta hydrolase n=1 Tax=Microbacterium karelineae TaxID=2654283 RepID=UPI0012EA582A|nr:tannase/feruloyl esterase family alpha/beta hydrolase [Microbacterium karelineae]
MKPSIGRALMGIASALALVVGAGSAATAKPGGPPHEPGSLTPDACAALVGHEIPERAIDLPTGGASVETAEWADDHCEVTGWIRAVSAPQDMQFQVNLPAAWNGRALQFGGGGFDGSLVTATGTYTAQPNGTPTALDSGWVTLGSDGGHQGDAGFDGRFQTDPELLMNYGQWSVKKAHDAAWHVIDAAYGAEPTWSYFIGGSQGGHEALDAAARYPKDYDGVVANYPAYNVAMMHIGAVTFRDALLIDDGAGWLSPAKTQTLTDAVYAACDELDGVADGIVSNVVGCDETFELANVRCEGGVDTGDDCLSDAQLRAVRAMTTDDDLGFEIEGNSIFAKSALLQGAFYQGFAGFGTGPYDQGLQFQVLDATSRYGVSDGDPDHDTFAFDPADHTERIQELGEIMDVTDVSLNRFRAYGGKVILTHGTIDDFITPHNTVQYYERQQEQFRHRLGGFMKFYMVPGWGHGQGAFQAQYDGLGAIVDWVEDGTEPAGLVASDGNAGADRTRPMCEYPAWPEYDGEGSPDDAGAFRCVAG